MLRIHLTTGEIDDIPNASAAKLDDGGFLVVMDSKTGKPAAIYSAHNIIKVTARRNELPEPLPPPYDGPLDEPDDRPDPVPAIRRSAKTSEVKF